MKKLSVIIIVLAVLLSACLPAAREGGTFRTALGANPTAIDPPNAIEAGGQGIASHLFDGLVKYNPKTMEVEPAVAKSWIVSKDAKTLTFYLRKGVKFHNSEEVDAYRFKEAFDYITNPENQAQASYYFELVKGFDDMQENKSKQLSGVKVVSKYTLQIKLSRPSTDFITTLPSTAFSPLPKGFKAKDYAKKPIGNGPFSFVSWKRDSEIVLKKFGGYYGKKAHINKAVFKIFSDSNTALREFKASNLDASMVPENQVNILKKDYILSQNMVTVPLLSTYSYGFNLKKKPWDNKNLRLSIAYAFDREKIIEKSQPEETKVASSFTSISVPGNLEPLVRFEKNLAEVKKYLKKAGYEKPSDVPTLTITYATEGRNDKVAQVIQNQLEEAGFKTKVQGLEFGTFIDNMLGGQLSFFQMKWVGEPNFDSFLDPIFSSSSIGNNNVTNYSSKKVDNLIIKAQSTLDQKQRTKLYKQAEKNILADMPIIPLFYDNAYYVIKPYVKDYFRNAADELALEEIQVIK